MKYVLLGSFGIVGVFARYAINDFMAKAVGPTFPVATLSINILGSFLIGFIYVVGAERSLMGEELRMAIVVGLLGGFTTFSAFSLESVTLLNQGEYLTAVSYIIASAGGGLIATASGLYMARFLL